MIRFKAILNHKASRTAFALLLVFALIFIRYCYYGFEYYYQLDDYIQYHNYTAYNTNISVIINTIGMLGARPLAGILDITVWAHFFPVMIIGVAIVSALYAASAYIFKYVWSLHFGTSWIFIVVYALLPLGFEGTYWMSASTRIVVGLFFASLSMLGFEKWCAFGRVRYAVIYAVMQILAYAVYEQVLVFSFAATVLLAALYFKSSRKRAQLALFAPAAVIVYFLFISFFVDSSAVFSTRSTIALPVSGWYFNNILPVVLSQIKSAFLGGGFYTLFRGFARGVRIMLADFNILYAAGVLLLCCGLFFIAKKNERPKANCVPALVIGLLLALAPIAPFFILELPWLSLRGTVASFCGIALLCDTLVHMLLGKLGGYKTAAAAVAATTALVFCIASVSELHDYRRTTQSDTAIVDLLSVTLTRDGYVDRDLKIGLLNVEISYLDEQNYFYHEHIHGVTESDWALTGAVEVKLGRDRPTVMPISAAPMYVHWNRDAKQLSGFEVLYLYQNGEFVEVVAEPDGDGRHRIISKYDGTQLGFTYEKDESAYLVLSG